MYKQSTLMELENNDYKLIEFVELKDHVSSTEAS